MGARTEIACRVCERVMTVSAAGYLRRHGPRANPCPGAQIDMRPPRMISDWAVRALISVNMEGYALVCVEGNRGYTLLGIRTAGAFSGAELPEHTHAAEEGIPTLVEAITRMTQICAAWSNATWVFGTLLHCRWHGAGFTWNMQVSPAGGSTVSVVDAWQIMAIVTRGRGLQAVLAEHQHVVLPMFHGTLLEALAHASAWRPETSPEWCPCTDAAM